MIDKRRFSLADIAELDVWMRIKLEPKYDSNLREQIMEEIESNIERIKSLVTFYQERGASYLWDLSKRMLARYKAQLQAAKNIFENPQTVEHIKELLSNY